MSCFYQQIHKQGVGLQEDLEQGAQNSRGLGLKLKDQVQTSCCTEVKGIRGVGCSLGKHQVKRTSMVTDGQCVGTAETLISEGITKKETRDPREARWGERSKERRDQGRGRGAGMRAARPAAQALSRVQPTPSPLDIAMDNLQAVQVLHSTKQPRADAGALWPEEGVCASLRKREQGGGGGEKQSHLCVFKVPMSFCLPPAFTSSATGLDQQGVLAGYQF